MKTHALRLSRTKNLHFAVAPFPRFSAEDELEEKLKSIEDRLEDDFKRVETEIKKLKPDSGKTGDNHD